MRSLRSPQFLDERDSEETLTYFDLTTSMALAAFADAPVDVAVVEVGLGGAEDSTNVLQAGTCVLTPIGLDHTEWLGDTLERDRDGQVRHHPQRSDGHQRGPAARGHGARSCAGARRWARPSPGRARSSACCGANWPSAVRCCRCRGWAARTTRSSCPLHGAHQAQNAAVALAAVEAFLGAGASTRQLDPEVVREGFANATSPGRLERVRTAPTILLDAAHNPHGMAVTVAALQEEFAFSRLVAVVAVLADKDAAGLLELLEPVVDAVVCTRNSSSAGPARPTSSATSPTRSSARTGYGWSRSCQTPSRPPSPLAEADVEGELAAVGVLITGSVITVADARSLLVR